MSVEGDLTEAAPALLRLDATLAVWPDAEGFVPEALDPLTGYIRWYANTEWPKEGDANALDGLSVTTTTRWYLNCVSATQHGTAALEARARTQLLNQRPTVAGRACGLIYVDAAEPVNRSELGGLPLYVRSVVYAMLSVPG